MKKTFKKLLACATAMVLTVQTTPNLLVNATTDTWSFIVKEDTPLDTVYFSSEDLLHPDKEYFFGYVNGKVAIMDENFKLITKTSYSGLGLNLTVYNGKTAMIVANSKKLYGLCDLSGEELLPCSYTSLSAVSYVDNHSLLYAYQSDNQRQLLVDGKSIGSIDGSPYLEKVNNDVLLIDYNEQKATYNVYDLAGASKGTFTYDQLYKDGSTSTKDYAQLYQQANTSWLAEKRNAAAGLVSAKFQGLGYTSVDFDGSFSCYNAIPGRANDIYYYVYCPINLYKDNEMVANTVYGFIYDAQHNLLLEGMCNMDNWLSGNDGQNCVGDLYFLTTEGSLQKFHGTTGTTTSGTATKAGSLLYISFFDSSHAPSTEIEAYQVLQNGSVNFNEDQTPSVGYTYSFLLNTSKSQALYADLKSTFSYTQAMANHIFLLAQGDTATDVYALTNEAKKLFTIPASLATVQNQCTISTYNGTIVFTDNIQKQVHVITGDLDISKNYAEVGLKNFTIVSDVYENTSQFGYAILNTYDAQDTNSVNYDLDDPYLITFNKQNKKYSIAKISNTEYNALSSNSKSQEFYTDSATICTSMSDMIIFDHETTFHKTLNITNIFTANGYNFAGISTISGKLLLKYTAVADGIVYYGYLDTDGNNVIDALQCKVTSSLEPQQIGQYWLFNSVLLDKDGAVILTDCQSNQFDSIDSTTNQDTPSGYASLYGNKADGTFWGILYDVNNNKIIQQYKDADHAFYYGSVHGDHILLYASRGDAISWLNITTGAIEKTASGFVAINTSQKKVYVINKKQAQPLVTSATIKNVTYKISDIAKKTVTVCKGKNVSKITIPSTIKLDGVSYKVTSIDKKAFQGNKKTSSITIGANVTTIGAQAFQNCSKLKTITIKTSCLKTVGKNALKGTNKALKVKVPTKKKAAYKKLLKSKGNKKLVIK